MAVAPSGPRATDTSAQGGGDCNMLYMLTQGIVTVAGARASAFDRSVFRTAYAASGGDRRPEAIQAVLARRVAHCW